LWGTSSGRDHINTVVGQLSGEREITLGFVDLLRDDFIEKDRSRGIYFRVSLPGVMPVASGGGYSLNKGMSDSRGTSER